jgi:ketosteroid isomerase-like protein
VTPGWFTYRHVVTTPDRDPALQRLLDERDVLRLASAYCWALDGHDWDALAAVFAPDAVAYLPAGGPPLEGLDAIKARVRGALGPLDASQHLVGSPWVEIDGDTARMRHYLFAQHVRTAAAGGGLYVVGGAYHDRCERRPEGWRIVHRELHSIWSDGNLDVVRPRG